MNADNRAISAVTLSENAKSITAPLRRSSTGCECVIHAVEARSARPSALPRELLWKEHAWQRVHRTVPLVACTPSHGSCCGKNTRGRHVIPSLPPGKPDPRRKKPTPASRHPELARDLLVGSKKQIPPSSE